MASTTQQQYLSQDYLNALRTSNLLDSNKSPLAMLVETCNSIDFGEQTETKLVSSHAVTPKKASVKTATVSNSNSQSSHSLPKRPHSDCNTSLPLSSSTDQKVNLGSSDLINGSSKELKTMNRKNTVNEAPGHKVLPKINANSTTSIKPMPVSHAPHYASSDIPGAATPHHISNLLSFGYFPSCLPPLSQPCFDPLCNICFKSEITCSGNRMLNNSVPAMTPFLNQIAAGLGCPPECSQCLTVPVPLIDPLYAAMTNPYALMNISGSNNLLLNKLLNLQQQTSTSHDISASQLFPNLASLRCNWIDGDKLCGKIMPTYDEYLRHLQHHSSSLFLQQQQHTCHWNYGNLKYCNKVFSSAEELAPHLRSHVKDTSAKFDPKDETLAHVYKMLPGMSQHDQLKTKSNTTDLHPKINSNYKDSAILHADTASLHNEYMNRQLFPNLNRFNAFRYHPYKLPGLNVPHMPLVPFPGVSRGSNSAFQTSSLLNPSQNKYE